MAAQGPRQIAARVLRRVEEGAYVSLTLDGECQRARLTPPDRRLATTLVYGVLKGRARLDHVIAAYSKHGLHRVDATTLDLLRLGAFQILELRVPAHAAVDETVRQVRAVRGEKMGGFVNAVLRRISREGAPPIPDGPPVRRLSITTGAPEAVVAAAIARLGEAEAEALLLAEAQPPPLWLRVNPRRTQVEAAIKELGIALPGATIARSERVPGAISLRGADGVFDCNAYVEGRVTAQDLGAQLVGALLDPQPGETILDACAGVGGKSTQLAERMDDRGRVDAVDRSARKLELGQDHARRLGLTIVRAIEADLTVEHPGIAAAYDRVLLDAPCSGLGVARRHPEVRVRRGDLEIGQLAALQSRLFDAAARRVRPGGVLVYAVCTYTAEEGPSQLERFVQRAPDFSLEGEPLKTWPHRDDADAFFAARLRRR